jgi:microcystin-dependent protein
MATPYLGEIRMFAGNFAPQGWALCNGQLLAISQNDPLFNLIGTTYGGDGQNNFALPNLQGRLPVHQGPGFVLGQAAGVEMVTLLTSQMPTHTHNLAARGAIGTQSSPQNGLLAASTVAALYYEDATDVNLDPTSISVTGSNQPHENMQPFLAINFIIALDGVFPSQT